VRVKVFDDMHSIAHFVFGVLAYWLPAFFIIFFAYEVIEFTYKHRRGLERPSDFIGDIFEFTFGIAVAHLATMMGVNVPWHVG